MDFASRSVPRAIIEAACLSVNFRGVIFSSSSINSLCGNTRVNSSEAGAALRIKSLCLFRSPVVSISLTDETQFNSRKTSSRSSFAVHFDEIAECG